MPTILNFQFDNAILDSIDKECLQVKKPVAQLNKAKENVGCLTHSFSFSR